MGEIRLLLADSGQIFLEGLVKVLEDEPNMKVIGTCHSGEEAIKHANKHHPDVIMIDTELGDFDGIDAIQRIHQGLPMVNIIALTSSDKVSDLFGCLKRGVRAYISKNCSTQNLIRAINLVADGEVIISPPLATRVLEQFTFLEQYNDTIRLEDSDILSKREQAILSLVSQGFSNKAIATTLSISEQTVKVHLRNIMGKLHTHNRMQAVVVARATHQIYEQIENTAIQCPAPIKCTTC